MARRLTALLDRVRFWRWYLTEFRPMAGAEGDPDPDPDPDPNPDPDPDPEPDPDPDAIKPDDDWKAKARKNEARAKRERKAREEAERKLAEREAEGKSETERLVESAREEAKREALAEAEQERRSDRLEVAVTRAASRGIKLGDGDDAETHKFADPDDAVLHLERAIDRGDVDADDVFDDDGRPIPDEVGKALATILDEKPHLRATPNGDRSSRDRGRGDGGRGKGSAKPDGEKTAAELDAEIRSGKR